MKIKKTTSAANEHQRVNDILLGPFRKAGFKMAGGKNAKMGNPKLVDCHGAHWGGSYLFELLADKPQ